MRNSQPEFVYVMNVSLDGITPTIWRRMLVPTKLTFEQFHHVLQISMGWKRSHLYAFTVRHRKFEPLSSPGFEQMEFSDDAEDACKVLLGDVLGAPGDIATYTYDFGDNWQHTVYVESIAESEPGVQYPFCVAGHRRCPPEDCGGVPGYLQLIQALAHPRRKGSRDLLDWAGGKFDPDEFSADAVNAMLHHLSADGPTYGGTSSNIH